MPGSPLPLNLDVVDKVCNWIEENGSLASIVEAVLIHIALEEEGLFRVAGVKNTTRELEQTFASGMRCSVNTMITLSRAQLGIN